jgi:hypothetical protein
MGTDKEWKRLCELYAEKSDEDLLDLWHDHEDLTQVAQEALAQVIKDRGLELKSTEAESGQPESQAGSQDEESLLRDEIGLWSFSDAFQASQAIRHMTEAEIAFRMIDQSKVNWDSLRSRNQVGLLMVVKVADASRAERLLRENMGLFPLPEGEEEPIGSLNLLTDFITVGLYSMEHAQIVAEALGNARISYLWRDGHEELNVAPGWDGVAIEVSRANWERALTLCEQCPVEALSGE